jgi:hypothetical protein
MNNATGRIMSICYGRYGLEVKEQGGGFLVDINPATTPERSVEDILSECTGAINAAGLNNPAPGRSPDQLRTEYSQWQTWQECLGDQGYEIGPLISLEEYLAAGGDIWASPGYDDATLGLSSNDRRALDSTCPPVWPTSYVDVAGP